MRISTLSALAACAALVALTACTRRDDAALAEASSSVFRGTLHGDIRSWDPALAQDASTQPVLGAIYETLYGYEYSGKGYVPVPLLAADVPMLSPDRKVATIPLRKDVRFQDHPGFPGGKGREVQARDYVHSFKRVLDPGTGSPARFLLGAVIAAVEDASTPEAPALRLRLKHPAAELTSLLAMPALAPLPAEITDLQHQPAGTGAFRLEAYDPGRSLELVRNPSFHPDFFAGHILPQIQRVRLEIVTDRRSEWRRFEEGRLDAVEISPASANIALSPGTGILRDELERRGLHAQEASGASFHFLVFNLKDPVLGAGTKSKLLRQAISSAIDRARWIAIASGSDALGRPQASIFPEAVHGRPSNGKLRFDYDVERAKQLLARSGHPSGKGLPEFRLDLRGADELNRKLGAFFKEQLAVIGVRVSPVTHSFEEFLKLERESRFQIGYGGWTLDCPVAEDIAQLLVSKNAAPGPNASSFRSSAFDTLAERLAGLEPSKRGDILGKMDEIAQEEVPWVLGYSPRSIEITQSWLGAYRPGEIAWSPFKYLGIDIPMRIKALKKRF